MAAEAVAQVYRVRLAYIREAFRELGFKGEELEMRTRLYVCYHSWEAAMFGEEPERKLARLQKIADQTTLQKLTNIDIDRLGNCHLLDPILFIAR